MLKSLNTLVKERLVKGGPGSGRKPEGDSSVKTTPQERLQNKWKFRRDRDLKHLTGMTSDEYKVKFGKIREK